MPVSSSLHISFPTFPSCPLPLSIITIIHPFFFFLFYLRLPPQHLHLCFCLFFHLRFHFQILTRLMDHISRYRDTNPTFFPQPLSILLFLYYHHHLLFSNITAAFTTALGFLNNSSSIHLVFSSRASGSRAFSLILHERTFTAPASR